MEESKNESTGSIPEEGIAQLTDKHSVETLSDQNSPKKRGRKREKDQIFYERTALKI